MLSKSQIAEELAARSLGQKRHIMNILTGLAELAEYEIASGRGFSVPGIASVKWAYTAPFKKGEKWRKGDTVVGFGGIESIKGADSPVKAAAVKLKVSASPILKRNVPTRSDSTAVSAFLKTAAGKTVKAGGK